MGRSKVRWWSSRRWGSRGTHGEGAGRSPATNKDWRRRRAHGSGHADIGIKIDLSTWVTKLESAHVTRCKNEFPTSLPKKFFPNSKLWLYKNFIEHLRLKRENGFWVIKIKDICPEKFTEVDIDPDHLPWGFRNFCKMFSRVSKNKKV